MARECECPTRPCELPSGENEAIQIFEREVLGNGPTEAGSNMTCDIPTHGNQVVLTVLVLKMSSSATLRFRLLGSYDGKTWVVIGGPLTFTDWGWGHVMLAALAYPLLRVIVDYTAGSSKLAIYSGWIVFSRP